MELLRREALADAAAGNGDGAVAPAPAIALEVAPAPMVAPHRAAPPLPAVAADMLAGFRSPLPVQPVHPLSELVVAYAAAAKSGEAGHLSGHISSTHIAGFWDPATNAWHASSKATQSESSGLSRRMLGRSEHRLVAAADLAERHTQDRIQTQLALPSPGVELLAFVESARYDESTAVVTVGQPPEDFLVEAGIKPEEISEELVKMIEQDPPRKQYPQRYSRQRPSGSRCWLWILTTPRSPRSTHCSQAMLRLARRFCSRTPQRRSHRRLWHRVLAGLGHLQVSNGSLD